MVDITEVGALSRAGYRLCRAGRGETSRSYTCARQYKLVTAGLSGADKFTQARLGARWVGTPQPFLKVGLRAGEDGHEEAVGM